MRVLHVFNEIKYSGAEIMYVNAAPLFQAKGIEMMALSTGPNVGEFSSKFDDANIAVFHRFLANGTLNPIYLFKYFKGIYKFLTEEKVDVIHIHRSYGYWYFSLVGFLAGTKNVRTVHNVFRNRKITWFKAFVERFIARKVFGLIFQTIGDSVYFNELNYYKNPSIKINNWYNNNKFYPSTSKEEREELRLKLNIPTNSFVIISTGACSHVKNHHDIIKSLHIVNQKNLCLYLHLGTGEKEKEEILLAESLGVIDNVRFLGNQTNVREYLIASDIYIMPSRFEGLSIAAIEAMACGVPSIFYNVPGLRDLVTGGDNGSLIDPEYEVLAKEITLYLNHPELRVEKASNALAFVKANFSMDKGVESIIDLYQ